MTHQKLVVQDVLKGNYKIPLYQRNFAWTREEIEQLIQDIFDACSEKKEVYYIGTLVVDSEGNIIDGQQRTTALTLIALALQNDYHQAILTQVPIFFPARERSNKTLHSLFEGNEVDLADESRELIGGYGAVSDILRQVISEGTIIAKDFTNYLLKRVVLFKSTLPQCLDLNLYFERFNSRGEQLEAHEIIKARMMAKLDVDEAQKFARIWEACSDMNLPMIRSFKMRKRRKEGYQEREKIFGWHFGYYPLNSPYDNMTVDSVSKKSLIDSLTDTVEMGTGEDYRSGVVGDYTAVINFETLLLHAFGIMESHSVEAVVLDDKRLLKIFDIENRDKKWIVDFSILLMQLRHIFDNCIVRNANEDRDGRTKDAWFLQKGTYYEYQRNGKGSDYFVEERFTTNTFKHHNDDILMLQSMFAVTFTSNRDSRWLYEIMQFLYQHIENLHQDSFGDVFYDKLEAMARYYAHNRIFTDARTYNIKTYEDNVPVYTFHFIDYILWKNRSSLKEHFFDARSFKFTYRRSIEHWYPQNPIGDLQTERLEPHVLHAIGNLAIITDSQNSRFGNLTPEAKYAQWKHIFSGQSLKLQWMAKITDSKNTNWNAEAIQSMTDKIEELVREFMKLEEFKLS